MIFLDFQSGSFRKAGPGLGRQELGLGGRIVAPLGLTLAHFGSTLTPTWAKVAQGTPKWPLFDPSLSHACQNWPQVIPTLAQVGPKLAQVCPGVGPQWPHTRPSWPKLAPGWFKLAPSWSKVAPNSAHVVRSWPKLVQRYPQVDPHS